MYKDNVCNKDVMYVIKSLVYFSLKPNFLMFYLCVLFVMNVVNMM